MPVDAKSYPRPLPNPEWLGKLTEEILEPELPIVDPHHHLWDHPGSRYLLDELLADVNSGHNIVATVFIQCGSGYRTSGPEEMRPIGESEFVRAIAEEADRRGTRTRVCEGIVSFADLRLPNVDAVLEGQIEAAGGRFRGIRHIAAHDPAIIGASSYLPPPGLMDDPAFRRGLKRLPAHDLTFEAWLYHPQIKTLTEVARERPGGEDRAEPFRRPARGRPLQARRGVPRLARRHQGAGGLPEHVRQARRAGDDRQRLRFPPRGSCRRLPASWPMPGGLMSRPASRRSAPTAACSRATSRSTRAPAAIRCCLTLSSGWRAAPRPPKRPTCSPAPPPASTAFARRVNRRRRPGRSR